MSIKAAMLKSKFDYEFVSFVSPCHAQFRTVGGDVQMYYKRFDPVVLFYRSFFT